MRPSEVGLCEPAEDINWMVAYLQAKRKMAAYEYEEQERKRERDAMMRAASKAR